MGVEVREVATAAAAAWAEVVSATALSVAVAWVAESTVRVVMVAHLVRVGVAAGRYQVDRAEAREVATVEAVQVVETGQA